MVWTYFTFLLSMSSVTGLIFNRTDSGTAAEKAQCTCNHDIQQLYARIEALERSRRASGEIANMDTRAVYPDVIGFSVDLDNTVNDLPLGSNVVFDGIRYNAGSAYDSTTGVFTCPRSGMYLFIINVSSLTTTTADLALKINGLIYAAAVSEPINNGHDSTGAAALARHLVKGDRVWVETASTNNQDLYRIFTSFTGVLVQSTST